MDRPVFVLCAGRSGSTLLRVLLDSHPRLSCPSETNIAEVAAAAVQSRQMRRGPGADLDEAAKAQVRDLVCHLAGGTDGTVLCDKSLVNWQYAGLLRELWPEARFICLYRHVMDVAASVLAASPWGFAGYGLAPYAARSPDNFVLAAAMHWFERVSKMLSFEEENPDQTCGVRYEDLVAHPDIVAKGIWAFLGVEEVPALSQHMFLSNRDHGPGDHKIWFTDEVDTSPVGQGTKVPATLIPAELLNEVNRLLLRLDYQPLTPAWGSFIPQRQETKPVVLSNEDVAESKADAPAPPLVDFGDADEGDIPGRRDDLVDSLVRAGVFAALEADDPTHLVVTDGAAVLYGTPLEQRDRTDPHEAREADAVTATFVVTRTALLTLLTKSADPGTHIRTGEIRYYSSDGTRSLDEPTNVESLSRQLHAALSLVDTRLTLAGAPIAL